MNHLHQPKLPLLECNLASPTSVAPVIDGLNMAYGTPSKPSHGAENIIRSFCRARYGQATLEFALTLVLLLSLIFGMIDLSRMVYAASIVQAAATEGARTGVVDIDGVVPAIHDKMIGLDENLTQIDISMPNEDSILVGVTYKFRFIAPIIAQIVNEDGYDLHGSAEMIIR